ncbi:MAG: IclR family transcriptional regulator [Desulfobacterales bacterium]|jgi:DNA-binding IclR family transcriptional regulator|nr:IclR family transcriptional regulator [Desulfobacterales bacterium]
MKTNQPSSYRAPAVLKAFDLLKLVAESRSEITLSELARRLGYSKGTLHGMIRALLQAGALAQAPNRRGFFLGPAVVELAFRSWNYFRITEHAQPLLDELRDRIGETVFLGVLSSSRGLIVATAEAAKPLNISAPPGTSIPLLAGAVGKIYLSQQPVHQAEKIIDEQGFSTSARRSSVKKEEYLAELDIVRKQGYAVDNEEYLPGVNAVAAALGNQRGLPLAIWVVGFADSMTGGVIETIAAETQRTAAKLREVLDNRS